MRKFIQLISNAVLCSALLLTTCVHAQISKQDPYAMIQQVAEITFKRVKDEQQAIRENPNLLKAVVREELLPYVDYRYAAYKVIGKNIKKTTEQERKAFVPVFRDYLVTSYAQVFTLYNDQTVEFDPGRKLDKQKIVAVNTRVLQPGGEPIDISFKVRKNRKKNEWKAFDMVAEGISLLDSKQAELSSIIRQKGLTHVTDMLKEKAERDVVFKQDEQ
ncbi:MlaC/ttg2D family ABC transporter substrate-binding protein [Thalassotalea euphylliae]|uniref:Toluene tolerance protein n=1 Tax=Thalassotalea euphylliae TaxID=1655234 RepID=A0A3E0UCV8_9GAMM|nr:ABC transporter substrate-binding protein [Thalassotalea euphylliae]REL34417.1 toluene tolerance protein [Thalassotalea euphylliae]